MKRTGLKRLMFLNSVVRAVRSVGAIALTQAVPLLPLAIAPEQAIWAAPLIMGTMKELRTRYPKSKILKGVPL